MRQLLELALAFAFSIVPMCCRLSDFELRILSAAAHTHTYRNRCSSHCGCGWHHVDDVIRCQKSLYSVLGNECIRPVVKITDKHTQRNRQSTNLVRFLVQYCSLPPEGPTYDCQLLFLLMVIPPLLRKVEASPPPVQQCFLLPANQLRDCQRNLLLL